MPNIGQDMEDKDKLRRRSYHANLPWVVKHLIWNKIEVHAVISQKLQLDASTPNWKAIQRSLV